MEGALLAILTPSTLVFGAVVWLIVLILRKVIESAAANIAHVFPDKYEPWWQEAWREWVLPFMPIALGGLLAYLAPMYPFPPEFSESMSGRIFFGLIAGGASGYIYRFMKFQFKKYLPEKVKEMEENLDMPALETDEENKED